MDDELSTEYESNSQKILNVQCDIRNLKTAHGKINELIMEIRSSIQALDDRTRMFCPDGQGEGREVFELKVWNRLIKHAKEIGILKARLK
jgi:hypothetical protein